MIRHSGVSFAQPRRMDAPTRYLDDSRLSESKQANVEALLADARRNSRKTEMMDLTVRPDLSYHVKISP